MGNVLDIFEERGFVEQVTDRDGLLRQFESPTTCYIGFDPTARSLHAGNLLPIMALVHMQENGHRPIVVMGGGTAMVGDPSGKTEARPIMSKEEIDANAQALKLQFARFLDFEGGRAIMVNNADWLLPLNYIEFLRDIGKHFSVNRMLAAESYRARLETGLSFIEFNYMLLQAYDFWYLFKHYDCRLQMGGNDQWGNIVAGADLIRRLEGETVFGLTFPLLTTSTGVKMGKTHKGAIWLDPELTSPYEYYQYWINQDDRDVIRFLALFTFLPMEEIRELAKLKGEEINRAKEILAFEATKICHGKERAEEAQEISRAFFREKAGPELEGAPSFEIPFDQLREGIPAYVLFEMSGLCATRSESRRLIGQGGAYVNEEKVRAFDEIIDEKRLKDSTLILRAGKKRYLKVVVV
jgi:tyrosyl-tRNA synthetase